MADGTNYLAGSFQEQKAELALTLKLAESVASVFASFLVQDHWPYEVKQAEKVTPARQYSQSTNAMILFALGAASRRIGSSPLLPDLASTEVIHFTKEAAKGYAKAWKRLTRATEDWLHHPKLAALRSSGRPTGHSHVSWSPSFGWDDPFTLTWVVELVRTGAFGGVADDISQAVRLRARTRARAAMTDLGLSGVGQCRLLTWEPDNSLSDIDREWLRRNNYASPDTVSVEHAFPALRYVHLWRALGDFGGGKGAERMRRFMEDRLHNQLSRSDIRDGDFDPAELAFALEGLLLLAPNAVSRTLLERVFAVLSESQDRTPYWRPVKPLVTTPKGHVFFPLSVETANSLLRSCVLIEKYHAELDYFSSNLEQFRRYADWLRARRQPGTARFLGKDIVFEGWHSEHFPFFEGIHLWETSQVLLFLLHYAGLLERHIARFALRAANLSQKAPKPYGRSLSAAEYWKPEKRTVGEPLVGLGKNSSLQVFDEVGKRLIDPRAEVVSRDEGQAARGYFSLLLYGPPGTSKTSMADEISRALQWPLITVTPSDFIRGGESEVEERAKAIFEVLMVQSRVVILFDEIDRMILDRNHKDYGRQSDIFQFMTPSMLTKLRELRKTERAVFLIATNYGERIDGAAKRKGRIDRPLLLAPPDRKARTSILEKLMEKQLNSPKKGGGPGTRRLLAKVAESTPLFVYGELVQLFEDAVEELPEGDRVSGRKIALTLRKRVGRGEVPAISLGSYQRRFGGPQKPYDEFFVLVYLLLEVGAQVRDEDRKMVDTVMAQVAGQWRGIGSTARRKAAGERLQAILKDGKAVRLILRRYDFLGDARS